jgi:hypothetical protein
VPPPLSGHGEVGVESVPLCDCPRPFGLGLLFDLADVVIELGGRHGSSVCVDTEFRKSPFAVLSTFSSAASDSFDGGGLNLLISAMQRRDTVRRGRSDPLSPSFHSSSNSAIGNSPSFDRA